MSNMLKLGTAVVSLVGLGAVTYHYNRKVYYMGCKLWQEVKDSTADIKENGPDFSGIDRVMRIPDLEQGNEAN